MNTFIVVVSKGTISGVAIQSTYAYGPMAESRVDSFVRKCEGKSYEVRDVHVLNNPKTLDEDDLSS